MNNNYYYITFFNTKNLNIYLKRSLWYNNIMVYSKFFKKSLEIPLSIKIFKFSIRQNYIIFLKKMYFKCFINLLSSCLTQLKIGFFFELNMKGVGFNVYKKKGFLFFELGFSHYIGVRIPYNIIVKRFKARIALFSYSKVLLHNYVKRLLLLKKVDAYKGKGVIYRNQKIVLKEGKKR